MECVIITSYYMGTNSLKHAYGYILCCMCVICVCPCLMLCGMCMDILSSCSCLS